MHYSSRRLCSVGRLLLSPAALLRNTRRVSLLSCVAGIEAERYFSLAFRHPSWSTCPPDGELWQFATAYHVTKAGSRGVSPPRSIAANAAPARSSVLIYAAASGTVPTKSAAKR